ncbi:hypothetical protein [Phenylobacterium sp.]|uniref:hypothetical protein n=1 Tax=Phenylobacterium sp. TaxID=1871053 RepID=UPI00272FF4F6|nr:hypothetical protein [Phenylobacterium sp.]MDP1872907.1 hypothetical protein [Phenylobacterium sp.]MDP3489888.1 hypothetical protein [Phenylobacterium sp.]
MARWRAILSLAATALLAAACAPTAPDGIDTAVLDREIGQRIGDPSTCVLLAEPSSGKIVYRYGSNTVCARSYPGCQDQPNRTVEDLLKSLDPAAVGVATSCPTAADGSRSVGWAAGPVPGRDLVYAAVMEGQRALPGMIITDRLASAFSAGME